MTMQQETFDDKVERLANKLFREGNPAAETIESARLAARRILEESEARTNDPATTDPENPDVIRRSSRETAADGASGTGGVIPRAHDGD